MFRLIALAFAGTVFTPHAVFSQQAWQQLQDPTAAQVAAQWQSPPPEYGPEPYYGLNGNISIPQIERDFDTLHNLGFQAVTVQAGYGMPFAYLSPEYFAFFRQCIEEAKKRNLRVWIVDDAGYPSGFAGGRFTSEEPQLRMQALEVSEKIAVAGGTTLHRQLGSDIVSAAAVDENGAATPLPIPRRHAQLDGARRKLDGAAGRSRVPHVAHAL